MKNNDKPIPHYIYAMVDTKEQVAYIGKTTLENPYKKRQDILNDKIKSISGEFSENSQFIILESLTISGREAFRHVLAWYNFFEEHGFAILVSGKAVYMVDRPKEKTEQLYMEICEPYTLDEVLSRKILPCTKNEELSATDEKPEFTQLNIRVEYDVAAAFRSLSRKYSVSQNDTLKILMSTKDSATNIEISNKISSLESELKNREAIITQQRKKFYKDRVNLSRKNKSLLFVVQGALALLFDYWDNLELAFSKQDFSPIDDLDISSYHYPKESGYCFSLFKRMIYGKAHRSELGKWHVHKFVFFETLDGEKLKLRLFEKEHFLGSYPKDDTYKNLVWIIGYTFTDDGAANLILGIPLSAPRLKESIQAPITSPDEDTRSSLNDLISNAIDHFII